MAPSAGDAHGAGQRRHVRPSDRRLADLAEQTARSLDWSALRASSALWDKEHVRNNSSGAGSSSSSSTNSTNSDDFALYTRRGRERLCFMAAGSVACSLAEMRAILRASTDAKYAATMTELYGANFIYGAVVHRARSHGTSAPAANLHLPGGAPAGSSKKTRRGSRARSATATSAASLSLSPSSPASRAPSTAPSTATNELVADDPCDVLVKTATFVKPHLFARNEQWCFLDYYQPLSDGSGGFVIAMSSLDPDDVFAGKTKASVSQLQGVTAAYSVLPDPARAGVRVLFYAQIAFDGVDGAGRSPVKHAASKSTVAARLMEMAKATSRLTLIVRRRRLGAQVFASPSTPHVPPNARCVCCARSLQYQLLKRKKKCHVCGYFVCEQCSVKQHVARSRVKLYVVRVCEHCLERVDDAHDDDDDRTHNHDDDDDEDDEDGDSVSPPTIFGSTLSLSLSLSRPSPPPPPDVVMRRLLRQSLRQAGAAPRRAAVLKVSKYLVDGDGVLHDGDESDEGDDDDEPMLALTAVVKVPPVRLTEDIESKYLRALATHMRLREAPLGKIALPARAAAAVAAALRGDAPAVTTQRLAELRNVPEMEIVCLLASRELGGPTGIVAIAEDTTAHVVAATEGFAEAALSRDDVLRAHVIMRGRALHVPQPSEADAAPSRVANSAGTGGLRLIFGFPLTAADDTVVGTVCCFGSEAHRVTPAQHAVVEKLAQVASRLLHARLSGQSWRRVAPPAIEPAATSGSPTAEPATASGEPLAATQAADTRAVLLLPRSAPTAKQPPPPAAAAGVAAAAVG
ncbi:hypothetical protein PybrP1_012057 [[Pythium] brassicae (nom. inval.)]|nr:hypothetical protein PybrP1_012057 [[Pythium] brassicae (nom. inval.)]